MQANFSMFLMSSLPIRGIRIGNFLNLVLHLKQMCMLALWGKLWERAMVGSHGLNAPAMGTFSC